MVTRTEIAAAFILAYALIAALGAIIDHLVLR